MTGEPYLDYGPPVPERYGTPRITMLIRDPEMIYAYWECGSALRVRDVTNGTVRTIAVADPGSWFGPAIPDHEYEAEIGRIENGRFLAAAMSNRLRTPRRGSTVPPRSSPLVWD